jgi:hypothetical protein
MTDENNSTGKVNFQEVSFIYYFYRSIHHYYLISAAVEFT